MTELDGISWSEVLDNVLKLATAFAIAAPLGWDRERSERGPGLRTFPLVAIGSCAFLLIGRNLLDGSESHARLLYGLMTGIGFIGGGSILKEGGSVSGTATAASIWNTGAIGAAVAWNRFEIAIALSLVNFLVLRFGHFTGTDDSTDDSTDASAEAITHASPGRSSTGVDEAAEST